MNKTPKQLDFFERNLAVLAKLRLPHLRGGTTISLVERQVEVLRERQANSEERLQEFIRVARANDVLAEMIQRLSRRLLRANSLQATIAAIETSLREDFDAVVFNGYYNQYKFAPIRVEPNQRVRVWVIDDGPSENSAFHIVGTIFDTVWKEGTYLLRPDSRRGGSQVLDLQPAQGGFVEFSFAEPGFYPIVTHKFANASKGALGLFQAGDVTMPAAAGH